MTSKLQITPAHGKPYVVQTNVSDRLAFESTLKKNKAKWGELKDNTLKLNIFLAWNAATRLGLTTQSWYEFAEGADAVLDVTTPDEDDEPAEDEDGPLEVEGLGEGIPSGPSITSV